MFAQEVWVPAPEHLQGFEHRVRISQARKPPIRSTQPLSAAFQSAPLIGIQERSDGANFLDPLARCVNLLVSRW
jgi:hypothetical protein